MCCEYEQVPEPNDEQPDWDYRRVEQDWLCHACDPRSDLARMRDGEWAVDQAKADRGERIECADCGEEYVDPAFRPDPPEDGWFAMRLSDGIIRPLGA